MKTDLCENKKKMFRNQNGKNYEKYVKGVILITDI